MLSLSNLDANESVFFTRQLEQVKSRSYDKLYPELKARQFIPAAQEPAPSGAETITYRQFDRVGMAKMIANYADDLPRVDVSGKEFTSPIRALGASFGYNIQEIRAAAFAKKDLNQMRANAARETIEEQIDRLLALGDTASGIPGFLTNASVPAGSVSGGTWATKAASDPDLIPDDITARLTTMVNATKGREYPDTLLIPEAQFALIATTRRVDQPITILAHIRAAFPRITTIEPWYRLAGAGSGATDRGVLYKKSNDKLGAEVPQEFEALAPQEHNLEFVVPCHARVGGTVIMYPLSMSYMDGI